MLVVVSGEVLKELMLTSKKVYKAASKREQSRSVVPTRTMNACIQIVECSRHSSMITRSDHAEREQARPKSIKNIGAEKVAFNAKNS